VYSETIHCHFQRRRRRGLWDRLKVGGWPATSCTYLYIYTLHNGLFAWAGALPAVSTERATVHTQNVPNFHVPHCAFWQCY
jgi:hypothetical protein